MFEPPAGFAFRIAERKFVVLVYDFNFRPAFPVYDNGFCCNCIENVVIFALEVQLVQGDGIYGVQCFRNDYLCAARCQ